MEIPQDAREFSRGKANSVREIVNERVAKELSKAQKSQEREIK